MSDSDNDSKARVAFDLMKHIAGDEASAKNVNPRKPETREYWLTLYHQCYQATHGHKQQPAQGSIDH